jgi:hypothetical protein
MGAAAMSKRIHNSCVFVIGTFLGVLLPACGGGTDTPLTDGGSVDPDGGTGGDGGIPSRWPVPSDFPVDGPVQPGEGDTCQLSVQCAEDRQICVDDACVREERVTSAGLVLGDWRVLTPAEVRATTALPISVIGDNLRTVLDEHGEVAMVGYAGVTSGANALFEVGARTRVVELPAEPIVGGDMILPMGDGFLSEFELVVFYLGPSGSVEWSADFSAATRPPLATMGAAGHSRSLIHTPDGPVLVAVLDPGLHVQWDVLELQRLDLTTHQFVFMDFAGGPYLFNRHLGYAAMGPTGLELIVAAGTGDDGLGQFFAHTVATGAERPLGSAPMPWATDLRPASADSWLAVLPRDSLVSPCSSLAFSSESTEPVGSVRVFGSDVEGGHCEYLSFWDSRSQTLSPVQFSPTPAPGIWIARDATGLVEATAEGSVTQPIGSGLRGGETVASRFGKTLEVFSSAYSTDPVQGLFVVERSLRRTGGGI